MNYEALLLNSHCFLFYNNLTFDELAQVLGPHYSPV